MSRTAVRCTATTKNGSQCKAWSIADAQPPRCSTHAGCTKGAGAPPGNHNAETHGFYDRAYTLEELADLVANAANMTLDDEIAAVRVGIQRAMLKIKDGRTNDIDKEGDEYQRDLTAAEYAALASLITTGANTVARLLRARRSVSGDAADGIAGAIAQALDEIGNELGLDL